MNGFHAYFRPGWASLAVVLAIGRTAGRASEVDTAIGPEIPVPGRAFSFPRDHGSHPEFKLEWWYVTGHLQDEGRRRFGFQATFFRQTVRPAGTNGVARPESLHLGHMAWLDVQTGLFRTQTRLNRGGWDAGADTNRLGVWNGNWSLAPVAAGGDRMRALGSVRAEVQFDLRMDPSKPLVRFGEAGYSRKAADAGAASYYLSWPRLSVSGEVEEGGLRFPVHGSAWMDHEISSGRLGEGQEGWDWICIQLRDGREVMAYRMRQTGGATDPFSTWTWIDRSGSTQTLPASKFRWTPSGWWTSPATGARYPTTVLIGAPDPTGGEAAWRIEPMAPNQEVVDPTTGVAYWEGACRVVDGRGADVGDAYLELTGYSGGLAARMK